MWKTIDTAPKDGTEILIFVPMEYTGGKKRLGYGVAKYDYSNKFSWSIPLNYAQNIEGEPTHWMPLPPPPEV